MTKGPRITIREVARECGLALSTVSNALAGKHHVSEETRELVRSVSQRLGYRASGVARALRMQRTFAIGVLMADVANPSFPMFVRGIEDVAIREGCNLLLCNTDDIEAKQLQQMQTLLDRQVDGMILISQHTAAPAIRAMLESGPPFVLMTRRSPAHRDEFVGSDNTGGITAAVEHLHGLGHRRIAFVRGPVESSASVERFRAFEAGVARLGLDPDSALVYMGDYSEASGHAAFASLMALPDPPTAIMASNDLNAIGVIDAATEAGVAIPGQLSVTGFDDIAFAALKRIDLTTVRQPKQEMGRAAAEALFKRIHAARPRPARQTVFPTELVVRGSTGPARNGPLARG